MFAVDFIVAVLAMSQTPVVAQASPAPTGGPQSEVEVVAPTPRRVCRMVPQRGSHLAGRRICQTQDDRQQELDETQREVEDMMRITFDRQRTSNNKISRCGLRNRGVC